MTNLNERVHDSTETAVTRDYNAVMSELVQLREEKEKAAYQHKADFDKVMREMLT